MTKLETTFKCKNYIFFLSFSFQNKYVESTNVASDLLHAFFGSLVEERRGPHQGVWRVGGVAAVWRRTPRRGRHGPSWVAHGGHGPAFLEHVSTQDTVVVVMVVVVASTLALLPLLWFHFYMWPQRWVVSSAPTWDKWFDTTDEIKTKPQVKLAEWKGAELNQGCPEPVRRVTPSRVLLSHQDTHPPREVGSWKLCPPGRTEVLAGLQDWGWTCRYPAVLHWNLTWGVRRTVSVQARRQPLVVGSKDPHGEGLVPRGQISLRLLAYRERNIAHGLLLDSDGFGIFLSLLRVHQALVLLRQILAHLQVAMFDMLVK